jgi:hypothetical protein
VSDRRRNVTVYRVRYIRPDGPDNPFIAVHPLQFACRAMVAFTLTLRISDQRAGRYLDRTSHFLEGLERTSAKVAKEGAKSEATRVEAAPKLRLLIQSFDWNVEPSRRSRRALSVSPRVSGLVRLSVDWLVGIGPTR